MNKSELHNWRRSDYQHLGIAKYSLYSLNEQRCHIFAEKFVEALCNVSQCIVMFVVKHNPLRFNVLNQEFLHASTEGIKLAEGIPENIAADWFVVIFFRQFLNRQQLLLLVSNYQYKTYSVVDVAVVEKLDNFATMRKPRDVLYLVAIALYSVVGQKVALGVTHFGQA